MRVLVIPGRMESLNEYIAALNRSRHAGNAMKRSRTEQVAMLARSQLRGWKPVPPVRLEYLFAEPNRKRDKDNVAAFAHKVVQDGLVEAGVLANDGWEYVAGSSDSYCVDRARPRIEVRIVEVMDND